MKKVLSILIAIVATMSMATMGFAATSATVSATATVTTELTLTASVIQVDSKNTETFTDDTWGTTPTPMSFGTLTHTLANGNEAGLLFSRPYYYVAFLGGFTSGRKYKIQSTCLGLVGPTTITKGFGVTFIDGDPQKSPAEGGGPINTKPLSDTTGSLGTLGTAVATNKVLYDSGTGGEARVITAYFGIPPYKTGGSDPFPGFQPIPVDTAAGSYSGNVTFSIVLY